MRHLLPYCLGGRFSIKPDHDLPSALLPNSWELQWVQNQGQVAKLLVSPRRGTNGPSFMKPLRSRSGHMQLSFALFFFLLPVKTLNFGGCGVVIWSGRCLLRALKGAWHRWGPQSHRVVRVPWALHPPPTLHNSRAPGLREMSCPLGWSPGPALTSLMHLASALPRLPVLVLYHTLPSQGNVATAPSSLCSCSLGQDSSSSLLCKSDPRCSKASPVSPSTGLA